MNPLPPARQTWCQLRLTSQRCITTSSAAIGNIISDLLSRPPSTEVEIIGKQKTELLLRSITGLDLTPYRRDKYGHTLLPQGHHLLYFPSRHPSGSLLPDGTDPDHAPGPPYTRRLWAKGSVSFTEHTNNFMAMSIHRKIYCRESISNVTHHVVPGANEKIFVDIERQLTSGGDKTKLIIERRTLCFMAPKTAEEIKKDLEEPSNKIVKAPNRRPDYSQLFTLTPFELFHFSALTFNAHKIHLDRHYCREVEGHRDLLVHGPLLLILMFSLLAKHGLVVADLSYRILAPVYVNEQVKVCLLERREGSWDVWIAGPDDSLRVKGTAVVEGSAEHILQKNTALILERKEGESVHKFFPEGSHVDELRQALAYTPWSQGLAGPREELLRLRRKNALKQWDASSVRGPAPKSQAGASDIVPPSTSLPPVFQHDKLGSEG